MKATLKEPDDVIREVAEANIFERLAERLREAGMTRAQVSDGVAWYRRFWALKRLFPDESVLVSTQIDEIWHAHLATPKRYVGDCLLYFGGRLPHVAEASVSSDLLRRSCELWRAACGSVPRLRPVCSAGPIVVCRA